MDYKEAAETLEREARAIGLHVKCKQVPWSQSRNAKEKTLSVEWRCELRKGFASAKGEVDRLILAFDYSQGVGHLRGYQNNQPYWRSSEGDDRLRRVCEGGIDRGPSGGVGPGPLSAVFPSLADILHSLLLDGSAIDEGSFEEWASSLGYDPDSRKAEATWHQCVETGLKLRAALGDEAFRRFQQLTREM